MDILKFAKSFLPWRSYAKRPFNTSLQVKVHRQWTPYSCTASVAQMVAHYYGMKMSHRQAIKLTQCKPDGATLEDVAKALKREHGLKHRTLRRGDVRGTLRKGLPVMSNDAISHSGDHAILVIGQTPKGFWIVDPGYSEILWRHETQFFAASNEYIAVAGS